jgi:hypothetical protein
VDSFNGDNHEPDNQGEVAGRLQAKVKQSTQAINRLHNLLARVFPELATLTDDVATGWVLQMLDKYPTAERIAQARLQSLHKIPATGTSATKGARTASRSTASVVSIAFSTPGLTSRSISAPMSHGQMELSFPWAWHALVRGVVDC